MTHRDDVWSYCHRRLHRDDVQDAVADVFLVAWRRLGEIPDDDEALLWLYGVARNVVRNTARSAKRRERLRLKAFSLGHADVPAPEKLVVRRFEDRDLLEKVARLKPLDQELLRLRTWEELTMAQIGAVVGLSPRSVESRLARIRKRLAAMLEPTMNSPQSVRPRPVEEGGER